MKKVSKYEAKIDFNKLSAALSVDRRQDSNHMCAAVDSHFPDIEDVYFANDIQRFMKWSVGVSLEASGS